MAATRFTTKAAHEVFTVEIRSTASFLSSSFPSSFPLLLSFFLSILEGRATFPLPSPWSWAYAGAARNLPGTPGPSGASPGPLSRAGVRGRPATCPVPAAGCPASPEQPAFGRRAGQGGQRLISTGGLLAGGGGPVLPPVPGAAAGAAASVPAGPGLRSAPPRPRSAPAAVRRPVLQPGAEGPPGLAPGREVVGRGGGWWWGWEKTRLPGRRGGKGSAAGKRAPRPAKAAGAGTGCRAVVVGGRGGSAPRLARSALRERETELLLCHPATR